MYLNFNDNIPQLFQKKTFLLYMIWYKKLTQVKVKFV